jgi:hypothetical protein
VCGLVLPVTLLLLAALCWWLLLPPSLLLCSSFLTGKLPNKGPLMEPRVTAVPAWARCGPQCAACGGDAAGGDRCQLCGGLPHLC